MDRIQRPFNVQRGITRLPNELLDGIFSGLGVTQLHALSLACRATTAAANNALYQKYTNYRQDDDKVIVMDKPPRLFLRTLCERPDLAAKVKKVDIMGWETEHNVAQRLLQESASGRGGRIDVKRVGYIVKRISRKFVSIHEQEKLAAFQLFQLFLNSAMKAGLIPYQDWTACFEPSQTKDPFRNMASSEDLVRNLHNRVEDAYIVLILALLPNIESLSVRRLDPDPILDWHYFFSKSSTALRALRHLRYQSVLKIQTSTQILEILPNLAELELLDMQIIEMEPPQERLPTSQLKSLTVSGVNASPSFFNKLINGQGLEEFHYTKYGTGHLQLIRTGNPSLEIPASSHGSLRRLTFNAPLFECFPPPGASFSMLQLINLQFLQTTLHSLTQSRPINHVNQLASLLRQRIPPSVITLHIRRVPVHFIGILGGLVYMKEASILPNLRIVKVYLDPRPQTYGLGAYNYRPDFDRAHLKLEIDYER